jgi:hypothetical protein
VGRWDRGQRDTGHLQITGCRRDHGHADNGMPDTGDGSTGPSALRHPSKNLLP